MLIEVEIRDFAIVREARVTLGAGLCVLTGETGAGKSIVIDAIGALLGARAGGDLVRAGAPSARLRALFDLADQPSAPDWLADLGIEADPDGLCVLTREIRADSSRSRCTINGQAATVSMLRQLGERLLDIHGQHEHQSLMRVSEHLGFLDSLGGEPLRTALAGYREAWQAWSQALAAIEQLRFDEGEKLRRLDSLNAVLQEIAEAALQPGEVDELLAERSRLAHAESLAECAATACQALTSDDDGPSAVDRVAAAVEAVREMAEYDADLAPLADELATAATSLQEAARALVGYGDGIEADPYRLDTIEARLELIERLQRKYGGSVDAVLTFAQRAEDELVEIQTSEERLARLEADLEPLTAKLAAAASALSAVRATVGQDLTARVTEHLADLGMPAVTFLVQHGWRRAGSDERVLDLDDERLAPRGDGVDEVEFLFSANPGEPARPLARIASGGEMSRVMLALKSQLAEVDAVPTLVFDEIDVGIGGVTIHKVAQKLAVIARHRQVLCITHHAPIAATADVHIAIEKQPDGDGTQVTVTRLEAEAQVLELARMLGKQPPTAATIAMARELLAEMARETAR